MNHDYMTPSPHPPIRSELSWSTKQREHEEEELQLLAAGAELTKPKLTAETVPQAGEML